MRNAQTGFNRVCLLAESHQLPRLEFSLARYTSRPLERYSSSDSRAEGLDT